MSKPRLRIVSDEPRDNKGMRADVALDHRYRAKRSGQSPVEYANAITAFRRPVTRATKLYRLAAVVLVLAAVFLGAL